MALVRIKNFPDRMYAERAQQTLENEGIPSVVQSVETGILGAGGAAGFPQGADLYVEEEHAEEARQLLSELFNGV